MTLKKELLIAALITFGFSSAPVLAQWTPSNPPADPSEPERPEQTPELASTADADDDGLTNAEEDQLGTDKFDRDTDRDGLTDFEEVRIHGTDPLLADSDADGQADGVEMICGADPLDADSKCDLGKLSDAQKSQVEQIQEDVAKAEQASGAAGVEAGGCSSNGANGIILLLLTASVILMQRRELHI